MHKPKFQGGDESNLKNVQIQGQEQIDSKKKKKWEKFKKWKERKRQKKLLNLIRF